MAAPPYVDLDRRFAPLGDTDDDTDGDHLAVPLQLTHRHEGWPELLNEPCVVVLGEAGTGKTAEFREQAARLASKGSFAAYVPLERLAAEPVERILAYGQLESFTGWLATDKLAYFFLDALDEAHLVQRHSLARALSSLQHSLGRRASAARLYISCRVSDWRVTEDHEEIARYLTALDIDPPQPHVVASGSAKAISQP
ncbi:MAG: hypothetical protein JW940_16675 [Polyangiaceae bacterium]|nr:hypothetical protein [Polyangiaceae bacterium]